MINSCRLCRNLELHFISCSIPCILLFIIRHTNCTDFPDSLSLYPPLSFITPGKSSKLHPVWAQSWCKLFLARSCVGSRRKTSSLLLQQCSTCLVRLTWMACEMLVSGCNSCCPMGFVSRVCSKLHVDFTFCSHLPFSAWVLLTSIWWIHTVVLTQSLLGRNPILVYQIDQISIWSVTCQ